VCRWAPAACCEACEWPALAATACVVLFDTAVLVILATNMLAPGRYRRDIPCLRISLPYIVGPQSSSHLHFQPLARWAKSVSRSRLSNALAARASLLFTFHTGTATAILRLRFRRHLSCRREGVSFAFRLFPVTPLQILLPASL
jgi:hypothetical protein